MNLLISHVTRYEYDRDVQLLPHLLYLRPRENPLLQVNRFAFTIQPEPRLHWMRDDFDNLPACARFSTKAAVLEIQTQCAVTATDTQPFDIDVRDYAVTFPFTYEPLHRFNLTIYLTPPDEETQAALRRWLDEHFTDRPRQTVNWLFALNEAVNRQIRYIQRDEPGIQKPLTTLAKESGSCRDLAAVLIAGARTLGLAARFVSGYMFDPAANGSASGTMHAWAEVFLPGAGWRGLDPTHGVFCYDAHVPVAHAVVAESVNPVQGAFFSAPSATAKLTTDVRVRKLE
jgi:transglutaminase-like putative cysteine protease